MVGYLHKWESFVVETLFDLELRGFILLLTTFWEKKKVDLNKLFISDEWSQHKLSSTKIGQEVKKLMLCHSYWDKVAKVVSLYKSLYVVLWIMNLKVIPTMPFVYKLMQVMKENLIHLHARK